MAGYTRQDTANNIANGNVINADDLDGEFNAIEAAFDGITGHAHDGTTGSGPAITTVGPGQDVTVSTTAVLPKVTNTVDIGSAAAQFRNGYFDGTLTADDLVVDASAVVVGQITASGGVLGNLIGNASTADAWSTGRSLTLTGSVTGTVAGVDGSGDIVLNTAVQNDSHNHTTSYITDFAESTQDVIGGMVSGNVQKGIQVTYNDSLGKLDFDVNDPVITLTGDVSGTATMTDLGNVSITTTIVSTSLPAGSVTLGTTTNGDYVASLVQGTGVTITNNSGETATPTIAIGQNVATTASPVFDNLTLTGNLTVQGATTVVNTETVNIADNIILLNSNETGTPTQNAGIEVERGTSINKTLVWDEATDRWTVGTESFSAGTFIGNLTGTASAASSLQTARNIALAGDVTGSASFDGSSNVTITATVADDSHNHIIGNVDGLQTALDSKAAVAGSAFQTFSASTLNATTVDLGNWTITESGGVLYFASGGTNRMKLDGSGNLVVSGNVTAYGTV